MSCTSPVLGHPCGKCPSCRSRSRQEWVFRLQMEYECCNFGLFLTLTYNDEHLPFSGVNKRDVQLFMKRLRKHFDSQALRFYLVSEYGDHTFRPHYHALFFFKMPRTNDIYDIIESSWQNGNVQFGEIEEGSIVYCTKYCMKGSEVPPGMNKNFRLVSKMHGGIGADYISKQAGYHEDLSRVTMARIHGRSSPMPRYYRTKLLEHYDDFDKDMIKYAYLDHVNRFRMKSFYDKYQNFLIRRKLEDSHDSYILYMNWRYECHKRQEQIILNRTKKQNTW